jgi:TonB-like protein
MSMACQLTSPCFSPLGFGLDDLAQAAIARWTFTPGTKDGKPVKIWATIEVNFRFKDERFDTKAEHRRTEFNVAVRHLNRQDPKAAERAVKTIQDLVKQKFPPVWASTKAPASLCSVSP